MNKGKALKNTLSQIYNSPRHTRLSRYLSSKTLLKTSILNKIKMGRSSVPVLTQSTAPVVENQQAHGNQLLKSGNQKWVASLAGAHLNNGDSLNINTSSSTSSSTIPPPSITVKDKAILMGTNTPSEGIFTDNFVVDTTLPHELRNKLGIRGIMPPGVDTIDTQIERCLARIRAKQTNLDV